MNVRVVIVGVALVCVVSVTVVVVRVVGVIVVNVFVVPVAVVMVAVSVVAVFVVAVSVVAVCVVVALHNLHVFSHRYSLSEPSNREHNSNGTTQFSQTHSSVMSLQEPVGTLITTS